MQLYSYVSIRLHSIPLLGFDNCMFEALRCCAGRFAKEGRGSTVLNRLYMLAVARARVHANGNNVIVLINRDTASVLCGRRLGISA